jgi:hypothetical protein
MTYRLERTVEPHTHPDGESFSAVRIFSSIFKDIRESVVIKAWKPSESLSKTKARIGCPLEQGSFFRRRWHWPARLRVKNPECELQISGDALDSFRRYRLWPRAKIQKLWPGLHPSILCWEWSTAYHRIVLHWIYEGIWLRNEYDGLEFLLRNLLLYRHYSRVRTFHIELSWIYQKDASFAHMSLVGSSILETVSWS